MTALLNFLLSIDGKVRLSFSKCSQLLPTSLSLVDGFLSLFLVVVVVVVVVVFIIIDFVVVLILMSAASNVAVCCVDDVVVVGDVVVMELLMATGDRKSIFAE